MKSIIALEQLIKEHQERITLLSRHLSEHEEGIQKLSRVAKASTETHLEESTEELVQYKKMLEDLLAQDQVELEEKERIEAAIERKKYFDNQNIRIRDNRHIRSDEKLEAMLIIDELPDEIGFEDEELIQVATKSLELNIKNHTDLNDNLISIKQEFGQLLRGTKNENLRDFAMLSFQIPILVLHFSILVSNIKQTIDEDNLEEFHGLPRYEDWWIHELWGSHQAYFALFKWKEIISNQCITATQKQAWSRIFDSWVSIKKMINNKKEMAFEYNFALDTLLRKHAELEEELVSNNLISMDKIIKLMTNKEDFSKVIAEHNILTPYLKFKIEKLESKEK